MRHQNGLEQTSVLTPEQRALRSSLLQMVQGITADVSLRDDLMQEALIHLWLTETRRPNQTRSWYLQSCRFHLHHYLALGRSIDSTKRREGRVGLMQDSEDGEGFPEQGDSGNTVVTSVSARELLALLSQKLEPLERAVLKCLANGLGAREIGRELKMSHTMVIRHRRKIAGLLKQLETVPAQFDQKPVPSQDVANGHGPRNGSHQISHRKPSASQKHAFGIRHLQPPRVVR